jgi:hypothetical protein
MGESVLRDRETPFERVRLFARPIEREYGQDSVTGMQTVNGDVNELGDAGEGPGKSYLFSFTARCRGIGLSGDTVQALVEPCPLAGSGASSTAHENPRESRLFCTRSYPYPHQVPKVISL